MSELSHAADTFESEAIMNGEAYDTVEFWEKTLQHYATDALKIIEGGSNPSDGSAVPANCSQAARALLEGRKQS